MQLTNSQKDELKEGYKVWWENRQVAKERNQANSELLKDLAEKFKVQKTQISAAFRYAEKAEEDGQDELGGIVEIVETMRE